MNTTSYNEGESAYYPFEQWVGDFGNWYDFKLLGDRFDRNGNIANNLNWRVYED